MCQTEEMVAQWNRLKEDSVYKHECLEVEFKLAAIPGPTEHLISNGVLMARELSILEVKVDKAENEKLLKGYINITFLIAKRNVVLTVEESHEGTQKTTKDIYCFRFHCIKNWEPVLKAKLQTSYPWCLPSDSSAATVSDESII
ncbi:UNVERIFIED_CONTAM: hypothetical protein K2H54_049334 [Gekko kuhli]